jgi:hypothetical protein
MAAPTITSFAPANLATDIVLGTQLTITFDQLIDHSTVNDSTVSLTGPGTTQIITAEQLVSSEPTSVSGREYITGTFSFDDTSGHTVVTFNPDKPLQTNTTYAVLVLGKDGVISTDSIKNVGAESMAISYRWTFKTGDLNLTAPPVSSPIPPDAKPRIDLTQVKIVPRLSNGQDLSQEIDIYFPSAIDPSSFNMQDLLVSIEPILGALDVIVPPNLASTVSIDGRRLRITITGW